MHPEPKTILLVEDDAASRRLVNAVLHSQGYRLIEAEDMRSARAVLAQLIPGFVLLDVRLADGDGTELVRQIRSDAQLQRVPVAAITAHAMKGDEARLREAGFDFYLPKPVDTRQLRRMVDEVMEEGRSYAP